MKLIKFRIYHYKSIRDSGWCWLASDITILAGKNESGKSAILEALRDFETDKSVPVGARPLNDSSKPKIEMCFYVGKQILNEIAKETSIEIDKEAQEYITKNNVTIIKHQNGIYDLEEGIKTILNERRDVSYTKRIERINQLVSQLSNSEHLSVINKPLLNKSTTQQNVRKYIVQIKPQVNSVPDVEKRKKLNETINDLQSVNDDLNKDVDRTFVDELVQYYKPKFIFFSDFSDILPFEIPFAEVKNQKQVQGFSKVSKLDLDKVINSIDSQQRRNLLRSHSARISGEFKGDWEQDELDLVAESDGENLRLGIQKADSDLLFKPEQRSKGLQWFLSFYLQLHAEQDETNVILIDEPGLYLHAKAQKDILKVLEKISEGISSCY